MRELKFRHYNLFTGEMLYSDKHFHNLEHYFSNREYDSSEEMQFTGLKDKNGVDIYKCDLLNVGGCIFEVVYSNDEAAFCGDSENNTALAGELTSPKVIGNIYENPGLLESE